MRLITINHLTALIFSFLPLYPVFLPHPFFLSQRQMNVRLIIMQIFCLSQVEHPNYSRWRWAVHPFTYIALENKCFSQFKRIYFVM